MAKVTLFACKTPMKSVEAC